jgi:hypothetical protein
MRKYIVCLIGLAMVLGFVGMSSAAIVTDPSGDQIVGPKGTGPTDILAAQAEQWEPVTDQDVLKVSYTATPNIGGVMIFEADVDSSTGTGGNLSMTGIPVTPCPCKTTAGIDVQIIALNRDQSAASNMGICSDTVKKRSRKYGEYFVVTGGSGTTDTTGALRGFTDPTVYTTSASRRSITFPWATLLVYVNNEAEYYGERFDYYNAINPATTKWQLSVWTDPNYDTYTIKDDFADGTTYFNISDVVPNGNGNLVSSVDVGTGDTFCEGNFDFDPDVDGQDASKFKSDFGRSKIVRPCPESNYFY